MYRIIKSMLFALEPETSHRIFISSMRLFQSTKIRLNYGGVELSNAAGLDKNGEIPLGLYNLGFDRAVVGTITNKPYQGNPLPRIFRLDTDMINRMGFPNDGSYAIAKRLEKVRVPVTANIQSTPGYDDIAQTIDDLDSIECIDRYEVNISCPNVPCSLDLDDILENTDRTDKDIYVKIAPEGEIQNIIKVASRHRVKGITVSNSLKTPAGGLSGSTIYETSLAMQKRIREYTDLDLIACGGIDSKKRAEERIRYGANGLQIFTPLIYNGPALIKEINGSRLQ